MTTINTDDVFDLLSEPKKTDALPKKIGGMRRRQSCAPAISLQKNSVVAAEIDNNGDDDDDDSDPEDASFLTILPRNKYNTRYTTIIKNCASIRCAKCFKCMSGHHFVHHMKEKHKMLAHHCWFCDKTTKRGKGDLFRKEHAIKCLMEYLKKNNDNKRRRHEEDENEASTKKICLDQQVHPAAESTKVNIKEAYNSDYTMMYKEVLESKQRIIDLETKTVEMMNRIMDVVLRVETKLNNKSCTDQIHQQLEQLDGIVVPSKSIPMFEDLQQILEDSTDSTNDEQIITTTATTATYSIPITVVTQNTDLPLNYNDDNTYSLHTATEEQHSLQYFDATTNQYATLTTFVDDNIVPTTTTSYDYYSTKVTSADFEQALNLFE